MMRCTLEIPHLIPPREANAVWHSIDTPSLKLLLARARHTRTPLDTEASGSILGMDTKTIAAAPLLAQEDGLPAQEGYWLCATPVHLETRHHALVLADPTALTLAVAESQALAATLAEHLRSDGISLHAPHPARWYLHCRVAPEITTSGLDHVIGHDIDRWLPQGRDALAWHRRLTELQMLLHTHPVNDAREAAGRAPVNSVWFWGGGLLAAPMHLPFTTVYSDEPLTRAIARHAGCRIEAAPTRWMMDVDTQEDCYVSWHALTPLMRRGDLQAWSAAVTALERDWFQPLAAALKARQVSEVIILTRGHEHAHRFTCCHSDRYKIFNKNKYLQ